MTKLEFEICESCHNGDIDISTRNTLLDIINESTAYQRHNQAKIDETRKELEKIKTTIKKYENIRDTTNSKTVEDKMTNKIYSLKARENLINDKLYSMRSSLDSGKGISKLVSSKKMTSDDIKKEHKSKMLTDDIGSNPFTNKKRIKDAYKVDDSKRRIEQRQAGAFAK